MMYNIYWHNILLRSYFDKEKAVGNFRWFQSFLLKNKLRFEEIESLN